MKVLFPVVLSATIVALAIMPVDLVGDTEQDLKEARRAVDSHMLIGEEICSAVAVPGQRAGTIYPTSYWVRLCTSKERGGGRQYTVKIENGDWAVTDECIWLASEYADPVKQVRVTAPISVALARTIVESLANRLWTGETVCVVRVHRDVVLDENGGIVGEPAEVDSLGEIVTFAKVETAPVENMFEVITQNRNRPGRIAILFAKGEYASVTSWGFALN